MGRCPSIHTVQSIVKKCSHCKKRGHGPAKCWKKHAELRPQGGKLCHQGKTKCFRLTKRSRYEAYGAQYFGPDYELDPRPSKMDNANTKEYLDKIRSKVVENLKRTAFAPSVQMTDIPRHPILGGMDDEADDFMDDLDKDENKDTRFTQRRFDKYTEKAGELSDSEDEEEKSANGIRRQPGTIRRRNQLNHRNLEPESWLDSNWTTAHDASSVDDTDMAFVRA